jgi:hypothetical protein
MMINTGSCVGSIPYCVQHSGGGGGGGNSGGDNGCGVGGCGGICYYCHYAPPRYTGGGSGYIPVSPGLSGPTGYTPMAPGFFSPVTSIALAIFAPAAASTSTSTGSEPNCLGPVEPSGCQTEQDLLGATYNKSTPWWKKAAAGLGIIAEIIHGVVNPPPGQGGNPPRTSQQIGDDENKGKDEGDDEVAAPPGGSGDPPPGGRTIIVIGEDGLPIGPPIEAGPPIAELPPGEGEQPGEGEAPFVAPAFLPGLIGDFGPGVSIGTGWPLWEW